MKLLVVDPEDRPLDGAWVKNKWDWVLDLGFAGPGAYDRWSEILQCPCEPLPRLEAQDFAQIRKTLAEGLGVIVDQYGLDWWDLLATEFLPQFESMTRLRKCVAHLRSEDEVFVIREGLFASMLRALIRNPVRSMLPADTTPKVRRYANAIATSPIRQIIEIAADKYDPGYRLRRLVAFPSRSSDRPIILLPSSYGNVSRTELAYAEMLPDHEFLLVTTRRSGRIDSLPKHVRRSSLAAYAIRTSIQKEFELLMRRWNVLKNKLRVRPIFKALMSSGAFDAFPKLLHTGLRVRDAWKQVFECEPVCGVLSADEANCSTRIPLLIAKNRNVSAISCHHGALDGRYRVRPTHPEMFLAKGQMEADYLLRTSQIPAESVNVGAPKRASQKIFDRKAIGHAIVFFSEPYEIAGARCAEIYREVLSALADLAVESQLELVLKLHPYESAVARERVARSVLTDSQAKGLRVVGGQLTDELLSDAWFAVTILSTTALDCTMRGVPVFLCGWLDYSNYGYLQQFARFGAGVELRSSAEIPRIPSMLNAVSHRSTGELWKEIDPRQLKQFFGERMSMAAAV